uniref:Period circadian protein n=1 Tax=Euphausia superba TaxID=6819 RepID=A0A286Q180_EUPSU|nr:period [Euphausia superba]AUI80368.1 period [Euphausia superba]
MTENERSTLVPTISVEESEQVPVEGHNVKSSRNPEPAPSQMDSAYGSLGSSSLSRSRGESCSGSKSRHSGSSQSSILGDHHAEFRGHAQIIKIKELKKPPVEKKITICEVKEEVKEKIIVEEPVFNVEFAPPKEKIEPEVNRTVITKPEENPNSNSQSQDVYQGISDQPTLVYTQALNYIRKIKERSAEQGLPFASPNLIQLPRDKQHGATLFKSLKSVRGFTVAISIQDGTALQVSPSITDVLGFPKDMMLGQSFIDFVYPKDSINFSSKIIHGLNMPFINESIKDSFGTSLFCRMRMYHSLRNSGFGVRNKRTMYKPCKMILKFHDVSNIETDNPNYGQNSSMILAEVIPIDSVYKYPGEVPAMGCFSIRHSASCNFSDYDTEAIPYLGHLPQDLTGNSVFDCYHPEDLPLLKTIYEDIVMQQGRPHRSKPYRFRTFNGSYVTLETEWLCFVNPWTMKIDSVIGQHRVIKGPEDIQIFLDPGERSYTKFSEEVLKEAQKAQNYIVELLAKPVASYKDPSKEPAEKRRRTLARMMTSIVDELDHMEKKKSNIIQMPSTSKTMVVPAKIQRIVPKLPSTISKGQESLNSSSGTPSSYGQLNYSETIHRFFRSIPKTISSDESGDSKNSPQGSLDDTKSSTQPEFSTSGASGSGNMKSQQSQQFSSCSGSGDTSDNNRNKNPNSVTSNSPGSYRHVQLTEEIMNRHNVDQQHKFVQKQRTHKHSKDRFKIKNIKKATKRPMERTHGLKRPGTIMDRECSAPKQIYMASSADDSGNGKCIKTGSSGVKSRDRPTSVHSINVFNSGGANRGAAIPSSSGLAPNFQHGMMGHGMSGYYQIAAMPNFNLNGPSIENVPVASPNAVFMQPQQQQFLQPQSLMPGMAMQYMGPGMGAFPGIVYQTVGPPYFNAPQLMLPNLMYQHTAMPQPQPVAQHIAAHMDSEEEKTILRTDSEHEIIDSQHITGNRIIISGKPINAHQRPDSRATSVKAEPGSVRGSMARESSHSHAAESIRSYVEDVTHCFAPKESEKHPHSSQLSEFSQSSSVQAEAESVGSPGKIDNKPNDELHASDIIMSVTSSTHESSKDLYYKSTDDSFLLNSESSEMSEGKFNNKWNTSKPKYQPPKLGGPSWLENVDVTPELLYKYQLETKELVDVLRQDMDALKKFRQPVCVDDQLSFLYNEMEREGESTKLHLEEGITSSSSGEEGPCSSKDGAASTSRGRVKKSVYFSTAAMLQEEDAPMPPPESRESSYYLMCEEPGRDSSDS